VGAFTVRLARLSQLAAENGVSTGKKRKNASPVKGGAQKSRRSEDQVVFSLRSASTLRRHVLAIRATD
jgi:hypothetical protein